MQLWEGFHLVEHWYVRWIHDLTTGHIFVENQCSSPLCLLKVVERIHLALQEAK
jgi:hypothetical protein